MNNTYLLNDTLEDLATATIRLGRELQQAAHSVCLGGNNRDHGFVSRTLRRLAERKPFEPCDDASLEAVRGILEIDLRSEVQGTERRFFETHYDGAGQHGEVRECPVYSQRGEALLAVKQTFESFLTARGDTLDRVAAERALLRLLGD